MMATRLSDQGFVETLYRHNEADLKNYVRRKLGAGDDVDDIIQEAFLRVATCTNVSMVANPRGFLFRVARNLTFDFMRRRQVRRAYAESQSHNAGPALPGSVSNSAEHQVSAREDLLLILDAVNELPEQCRRVFLLQRQDGLTYAEIAERLSISESMVQKHMSKALARLYRVLP